MRCWSGPNGLREDPLSGVGWGFAVAGGLACQGFLKIPREKNGISSEFFEMAIRRNLGSQVDLRAALD